LIQQPANIPVKENARRFSNEVEKGLQEGKKTIQSSNYPPRGVKTFGEDKGGVWERIKSGTKKGKLLVKVRGKKSCSLHFFNLEVGRL